MGETGIRPRRDRGNTRPRSITGDIRTRPHASGSHVAREQGYSHATLGTDSGSHRVTDVHVIVGGRVRLEVTIDVRDVITIDARPTQYYGRLSSRPSLRGAGDTGRAGWSGVTARGDHGRGLNGQHLQLDGYTVSTTDGETASQLDDGAEVDEEDDGAEVDEEDVSVEGNEEDASVEGNEEDDVAEEDEDEDEDDDVKEDDDEDNDEEDDDEEDDDEEDDDEEDVGSGGRGTLNGLISETVPSERGRGVVLRAYSLETGWSSRYSCPSTREGSGKPLAPGELCTLLRGRVYDTTPALQCTEPRR